MATVVMSTTRIPASGPAMSVGLRQAEDLLGDVAEDQLRADRRDARDHHLAKVALDVVLLRIAIAAVRHDGGLAGIETRFAREVFRRVGLRTAGLAHIVERRRLHRHQARGLELHPALRERMLDALVAADRTVEDDAFLGVLRGALERRLAQPDSLRGDEDAFGIHAVQDVFEAAALLADAVGGRRAQPVDEELVGVDAAASHLVDRAHLDPGAVEVGVEEAHAERWLRALLDRRRAREHQHLLRDLGRGDEHLGAGEHVVVALAHGLRPDAGGVQAGIGLGHREARLLFAADQRRQHARLLLLSAEDDHGVQAEDVHVHGRSRALAAARLRDGLHHDGRFGHAEAGAAVLRRHADPEPGAACHRLVEVVREFAAAVALEPVAVVERRAHLLDCGADGELLVGQLEVHAPALGLIIWVWYRPSSARVATPGAGRARTSPRAPQSRQWPGAQWSGQPLFAKLRIPDPDG